MTLQDQTHDPDHREHCDVEVSITTGEITRTVKVRAGRTEVSRLKEELGVAVEDTLFETSPHRRPLADHEALDVVGGEKFEAINGGGVS